VASPSFSAPPSAGRRTFTPVLTRAEQDAAAIAKLPTAPPELPPNVPEALGRCSLELNGAERLSDILEAVLRFSRHFFEKSFIFRVQSSSYSVLVAQAPVPVRLRVEALVVRSRQRTPFEVLTPPSPFYLGPLPKGAEEEGLLAALEEETRAPMLLLPLLPMPTYQLMLLGASPTPNFSDNALRQFTTIAEKTRLAVHIQQLKKRLRALPLDWT
jgi:hypothetical protein